MKNLPASLQRFYLTAIILIFTLSYGNAQQPVDSTNNYFYISQVQDAYYDSLINIVGIDSMQGTGYKSYVRWKGFMQMRVDGDGTLDTYVSSINNYYEQTNQSSDVNWTYYAPIGEPDDAGVGFGKGWVNKILIDESSTHYYAGTHNNGIWRTGDHGNNWYCITMKYPKINGIASMCSNNNNEILALTFANVSTYSNGLYRAVINNNSNDEWIWENINIEAIVDTEPVDIYPSMKKERWPKKIIVHPTDDNTIFVLTKSYIFKSTNAGINWTTVCDMDEVFQVWNGDEGFEDIIFDCENPNIMYVSGTNILKSTNTGNDWDDITYDVTDLDGVITCKMDANGAHHGKVWFFYTFKNEEEDKVGITKYDPASGGSFPNLYTGNNVQLLGSGSGKINIKVHPENEERLYISGLQIYAVYYYEPDDEYKCELITDQQPYTSNKYLHDDVRDMQFSNNTLYIGCDGGFVKANEAAGDEEWITRNLSISGDIRDTDLNISEVYAISTSGNNGKIAFNCQDIGGYYFYNNNLSYTNGGDGGALLFDNIFDDYIYACDIQSGFFAKRVSDNKYIKLSVPFTGDSYFFPPIVKDPGDPNVIYFGNKVMSKYDDIYTLLELALTDPEAADTINVGNVWPITDIAISHINPDIMYVSTKNSFWDSAAPVEDALYKSTNGGQTWDDISTDVTGAFKGFITDIELNPDSDEELWLTYGNSTNLSKVDYYHNPGSGWIVEDFKEGLPTATPVWEMVIDEKNGDKYLATDLGVFKRTQQDNAWENISKNGDEYKQRMVYDIEISHGERKLYASTFGGGIWYTELGVCPAFNIEPEEITGNPVIWSKPMFINSNLVIKEGATLIIKDVVYFHQQAKLIVERGGRLDIDGGKLTNSCDSNYWQGVEVWGNSNKAQDEEEQGCLYIVNSGCIENAVTGILGNKTSIQDERGFTGGIIRANSAFFINNITSVKLENLEGPSLSSFHKCNFITNDAWQHSGEEPLNFVELINYNGNPMFMACNFINNAASTQTGKGNGIKSTNSSIFVNGLCANHTVPCDEYIPSSFEGLQYGIKAEGTRPGSLQFAVRNSEFINNEDKGMYISAINNAIITSNIFTIKNRTNYYGLYVDHCTGYQIEENNFYGNWSSQGDPRQNYGLYINYSGEYDNLVYNNYFENLYYGATFQDENRITTQGETGGLCVKCNDFADNVFDVFVDGIKGIAAYQGSQVPNPPINPPSTYPGGNIFTDVEYDPLLKNIDNNCYSITYFHHQNTEQFNVYPFYTEGYVSTQVVDQNYDKQVSCPSTLDGGGTIESLKTDMLITGVSIDSTENELVNLIDNSDTDDLNFDVQTAMPDQSIETRNLLLDASPNLSDTVMVSAIDAENVLPNVMVRDVLVENPQAAKSSKVQYALDERTNQLPSYMRAQINMGMDSLSEVEITRAYLSGLQQKRQLAFNRLHFLYTNDTLVENVNDSLMTLYELEGGLLNKYRIAWMHFIDGDTITSDSLINQIQYDFELTLNQEDERQDYLAYMEVLNKMRNDSITIPDSMIVAQLLTLIQSNNGMPAIYARNMLVFAGEFVYDEPLLKADTSFKSSNYYNESVIDAENENSNNKLMIIKPNPAHNYFIVSYALPEVIKEAYLLINRVDGQFIDRIELSCTQDELVVNTDNMKTGTYLITLITNGKSFETSKVTIIK